MKSYPSISTKFVNDLQLVVFDKIDGSNIRAEWSKKKGFYKFGTRTRLLDESDPLLGTSKSLILNKYGDSLEQVFVEQRWERAIVFFEYGGPNSFAGSHDPNDVHDVILIDVNPYKKGILEPKTFLKLFGHLHVPDILFNGILTSELIDLVKNNELEGMTFEGVVCKYEPRKRNNTGMFKIKSRGWLNKLREKCGDNEQLFQRLK